VRYQLTHCPTLEAESPEGVHPAAAAAADAQEVCFVAHTEAAVAAGAELCVWYGHLAPDVALMQYGFLLPDGLEMSKVDQKGVTANEINGEGRHSPPPPQLSGEALERGAFAVDLIFGFGSLGCKTARFFLLCV
jgi:hypothetical protein